MFKKFLDYLPAFLQDIFINIIYGNDYDRRKFIFVKDLKLYLFIDIFNYLGKQIIKNELYEKNTLDVIVENLKNDSIFFDIGANEGYFSLIASRINTNGFNYMFEPQSRLFNVIKKNFSKNNFSNYKLIPFALGDNNYTRSINLFSTLNTGASSFLRKYRFFNRSENVKVVSLDNFLKKNPKIFKIDLIKIDIEGFEINAVEGMKETLMNRKIESILIDYHLNIISQSDKEKCEKFIISCGYKKISEKYNDYTLYKLD